jgi:prepilin-type N-terminal cleavage/methylation domain-containing protein/prepilin-type processing-associated H-X9-DG protein
MKKSAQAFTLIEMLVVIAIIALLAAILIPVTTSALLSGRHTVSRNNLRQWGMATTMYATANNLRMPTRGPDQQPSWSVVAGTDDLTRQAWYNALPPYVSQPALADIAAAERVNVLNGTSLHRDPEATFTKTLLAQRPLFSYAFNSQLNTSRTTGDSVAGWGDVRDKSLFISDYTSPSDTVLFFESRVSLKDGHPSQTSASQFARAYGFSRHISFRYKGKANLGFLDGSVRAFKSKDLFTGTQVVNEDVKWAGLP